MGDQKDVQVVKFMFKSMMWIEVDFKCCDCLFVLFECFNYVQLFD